MIDYKAEAKRIARSTAMDEFEGTCYRAIIALCRRVAAETFEEAAGIAESINHIANTRYLSAEAVGKEIAAAIRTRKEGR